MSVISYNCSKTKVCKEKVIFSAAKITVFFIYILVFKIEVRKYKKDKLY